MNPTTLGKETAGSCFLKAIANTIKRLDHIELNVACLELLAQSLDVAVDSSLVHVYLIVVSSIHQGVAAFDYPRPARQGLQEEKLGYGERHRGILPSASMPLLVHAQLAAFEDFAIGFLCGSGVLGQGATQDDLDPFGQQTLRKRFTDEVIGPNLQASGVALASRCGRWTAKSNHRKRCHTKTLVAPTYAGV